MGVTLKQILVGSSISLRQEQQQRRLGVLSPAINNNDDNYYSYHHNHHHQNNVVRMSHHHHTSNIVEKNNTVGGMWRLSTDTNDQVPDVSYRILCWMLASLFIPVVLGLMIKVIWLLVKKKHNPILQIQLPFLTGLLGLFACALYETKDFVSSLYLFTIFYSVCATCMLTHTLFVCNQQQDSSCFALLVGLTGHVLVVLEYGALDERFAAGAAYAATSLAQRNIDFLLFCAYGILLGVLTAVLCLWCPVRKAVLRSQKTYMMYTTVANLIVWYRFIYCVVCHRGGTTWFTIMIEGSTLHACIYLIGYALPMYAIFESGAAVV
ncbi:G protein-coupled receptor-4A [Elephant endotheliotropic herpesvirus 3A]|uniref:G protein-coupled receptor-4A n=1 Tax=Elephant endotheliotropic herpesvirus 3A TaxID=1329409 RepID=A0A866VSW8_9BETA|nr:G protein-coupled receptor-4A [Elephant endotheliotropic herpesvirus 3A]QOE74390.1 G protein-coupled receptor-4A [Elephant endotheliotropic herpesvirus 3A]